MHLKYPGLPLGSHLALTGNFNSNMISPTLKRTEGRAPVWGSEFTSKDAALQGGSEKLLSAKLCDLPGDDKNIREKQ